MFADIEQDIMFVLPQESLTQFVLNNMNHHRGMNGTIHFPTMEI